MSFKDVEQRMRAQHGTKDSPAITKEVAEAAKRADRSVSNRVSTVALIAAGLCWLWMKSVPAEHNLVPLMFLGICLVISVVATVRANR